MVALANQSKMLILRSSESNEWYTPIRYMVAAREVMHEIELDPASSAIANQVVQAKYYYTQEDDGLIQPWNARTLWLNPPYGRRGSQKGNVELWISRLIEQYNAGNVQEAILLVNAVTERRWFDSLWNYPICFASIRISFWNAQGDCNKATRPTHGNAFIYFGKNEARFMQVFDKIGPIVKRVYPLVESPPTILWEVQSFQ